MGCFSCVSAVAAGAACGYCSSPLCPAVRLAAELDPTIPAAATAAAAIAANTATTARAISGPTACSSTIQRRIHLGTTIAHWLCEVSPLRAGHVDTPLAGSAGAINAAF